MMIFWRLLEKLKWLGHAFYWLRTHTVHRYHLIDLRGQGDYTWGWIDRDWAMYLACFKLLVDYVERERPFEIIDWNSDVEHAYAADEIKVLYAWWKGGRKADYDALEAIDVGSHREGGFGYDGPGWDVYCKRSEELDAKDDAMLDRLIKVRKFLWT